MPPCCAEGERLRTVADATHHAANAGRATPAEWHAAENAYRAHRATHGGE